MSIEAGTTAVDSNLG